MEPTQPRQGLWCDAQQKASQRCGIRIVRQTAQVLKDTIGLQQVRRLDPFQTKNDRIDDRQQQFANAVAVVPLYQPNIHRYRSLETNPSQEAMEQIDATVMRQAVAPENYCEFSGSFCHHNQSYLLGSFHCKPENSIPTPRNRNWDVLSCYFSRRL